MRPCIQASNPRCGELIEVWKKRVVAASPTISRAELAAMAIKTLQPLTQGVHTFETFCNTLAIGFSRAPTGPPRKQNMQITTLQTLVKTTRGATLVLGFCATALLTACGGGGSSNDATSEQAKAPVITRYHKLSANLGEAVPDSAATLGVFSSAEVWPLAAQSAAVTADGQVLSQGADNRNCDVWNPADDGHASTDCHAALQADANNRSTATLLPNGELLALNGNVALLMPDASVLVLSGASARSYLPTYLFAGTMMATRPVIAAAPAAAERGGVMQLSVGGAVARVTLVATSLVAGGDNVSQRFTALSAKADGSNITAQLPADLPAGSYMLFVLDAAGVPSVAHMLMLK
jgi:Domain of unknown function (DUF1929)